MCSDYLFIQEMDSIKYNYVNLTYNKPCTYYGEWQYATYICKTMLTLKFNTIVKILVMRKMWKAQSRCIFIYVSNYLINCKILKIYWRTHAVYEFQYLQHDNKRQIIIYKIHTLRIIKNNWIIINNFTNCTKNLKLFTAWWKN